jgi:hypothetical protein
MFDHLGLNKNSQAPVDLNTHILEESSLCVFELLLRMNDTCLKETYTLMFFPLRNCSGVFDLSTQVLTQVFFMIFSIFQACTEECDSNTQVCNKYSLCFSSERNLYQRI